MEALPPLKCRGRTSRTHEKGSTPPWVRAAFSRTPHGAGVLGLAEYGSAPPRPIQHPRRPWSTGSLKVLWPLQALVYLLGVTTESGSVHFLQDSNYFKNAIYL